jgi:hypothetical protein
MMIATWRGSRLLSRSLKSIVGPCGFGEVMG